MLNEEVPSHHDPSSTANTHNLHRHYAHTGPLQLETSMDPASDMRGEQLPFGVLSDQLVFSFPRQVPWGLIGTDTSGIDCLTAVLRHCLGFLIGVPGLADPAGIERDAASNPLLAYA